MPLYSGNQRTATWIYLALFSHDGDACTFLDAHLLGDQVQMDKLKISGDVAVIRLPRIRSR